MKKYFCIIFLFLFCASVQAQRKFKGSKTLNYSRVDSKIFHFGFTVAMNYLDFGIKNSDYTGSSSYRAEQVDFTPSLTLAVVGELNLGEYFGLRFLPGFSMGSRTITYVNVDESSSNVSTLKSFYGDFPLVIKYRSKRIDNFRPYIISGISYRVDLSPHDELEPHTDAVIKIQKHDFAFEVGGGVDFYLPYFKFSTELKISFGLRDIMIHVVDEEFPDYDEYTKAIGYMNSKVVTLSFHFE